MFNKIIESSVFLRGVKAVFSLVTDAVQHSVLIGKTVKICDSAFEIKLRYIGIFIAAVIILKRDIFLKDHLGGAMDLKPFLYALMFISVLFLATSLRVKDAFKNSLIMKLLATNY